jgi:glutamate formiminotransferase
MASQLIECVPNFSEGRRPEVIEAIVRPFKETKGLALLDYRADPDHHRLVVSLAGAPEPNQDAVIAAALQARELIDLNRHQGGHPRMGAVDVIPFIPLQGADMADCVELAHSFGRRLFAETGIPVYFYEEAAQRPERRRLEAVRRGQFEALKKEAPIDPDRAPDVGGPGVHQTAGASAVGARKFLIAFNVNLGTSDLETARRIARAVRASSGGLGCVKAIGLALEDRGLTQISMNLVDYEKNALYRVVEMIRFEARRWGVKIVETEVYGMIPAAALIDSAAYYLQMADFDSKQVVELALLDLMEQD